MATAANPPSRVQMGVFLTVLILTPVAIYDIGGFQPSNGAVEILGTNWTFALVAAPAGSPPPLWYPLGDCLNLSGSFPAGANITCYFVWVGEHCVPLAGTSAVCSEIVGALVNPPFRASAWFPTVYCPQGGCGTLELSIGLPRSAPTPEVLTGTLLFQAYFHT